jgi:hypothetical protein
MKMISLIGLDIVVAKLKTQKIEHHFINQISKAQRLNNKQYKIKKPNIELGLSILRLYEI